MDLLRRWYRRLLDDGNNSFFSKSIIIPRASRDQLNDVTRAILADVRGDCSRFIRDVHLRAFEVNRFLASYSRVAFTEPLVKLMYHGLRQYTSLVR